MLTRVGTFDVFVSKTAIFIAGLVISIHKMAITALKSHKLSAHFNDVI